jgi:hypothetical protein
MISFIPFEGSGALIRLLDETFAGRECSPPPKHIEAVAALTFIPLSQVSSRAKRSPKVMA